MKVSVATHRDLMLSRFLRFAGTGADNECWMWKGSRKSSHGYGQLTVKQQKFQPHRVSYELFVGPIPHGLCVMHVCDTPGCTNPRHLTVGSVQENAKDMISKRRQFLKPGPDYPFSREEVLSWIGPAAPSRKKYIKLDEGKIKQIFSLKRAGNTYDKISEIVGISRAQAHRVYHGMRWPEIACQYKEIPQ